MVKKISKTTFFILLACLVFSAGWDRQAWIAKKCGDGICQKLEERYGSCPQDCRKTVTKQETPQVNESSMVKSVKVIEEDGGRVDWLHSDSNLIAFDRKGADGYYNIWIMNTDGSGQKCLTCNNPDLPLHNGNPAWHASGEYIVFQGQDSTLTIPKYEKWATHPGGGINSNLWMVNKDGTKFWKLTKIKDRMGVLHPHFSYDGTKILWAERVGVEPFFWGQWAIKIADFNIINGEPKISNLREIRPGDMGLYETHGFSPDNKKITFSASKRGSPSQGFDEFIYDLTTGELTSLTNSPDEWDEFVQFSPDGKKIVWISSIDIPQKRDKKGKVIGGEVKFDYWIADSDGSNREKLTHFNTPGYSEYVPSGTAPADYSWGVDSKSIIAKSRTLPSKFDEKEQIILIQFEAQ